MSATHTAPQQQETVRRGFQGLRCPLCGSDAVQSLDLDDCRTLHCGGCDEDYDVADVRELLTAWQRVLTWIDAAPPLTD